MYLAVLITLLISIAVFITLFKLMSQPERDEVRVPVRTRITRAGRRRY